MATRHDHPRHERAPRRRTELPAWIDFDAHVFLTICSPYPGVDLLCRDVRATQLWETVVYREYLGHWRWHAGVIMPDHVHLLVWLPDVRALHTVVRGWKRYAAGHIGVVWQPGYFDRRLRRHESLTAKIEYIRQNPVRAGLVSRPGNWPYLWIR